MQVAIDAACIVIDLLLLLVAALLPKIFHQFFDLGIGFWQDVGLVAQTDVEQVVFLLGIHASASRLLLEGVEHGEGLLGMVIAYHLDVLHLVQRPLLGTGGEQDGKQCAEASKSGLPHSVNNLFLCCKGTKNQGKAQRMKRLVSPI